MAEGQIMKALSGFYYVESAGRMYTCKGRGVFRNKKITPLVGDFVQFDVINEEEGYITKIDARKNEFIRPPIANITQAVIVNAMVQPDFSTRLLDRFLTVLESKGIQPIILVTKKDLANETILEELQEIKQDYERLGYTVVFTSLEEDEDSEKRLTDIQHLFKNEVSVLVGQSGVGKSSLLNRLQPELTIDTNEISVSLGRGKHTTRHIELWKVHEGLVADTPGFSAIELTDIKAEELSDCFVEIKELAPQCKFRSCLHDQEPKCAVKQAVKEGKIASYRYDHYISFLKEILSRKPRYSS